MLRVLMISTYGPNVRGISPYSDSLTAALESSQRITIDRIDYKQAFPNFLLPSDTDYTASNKYASIDYRLPSSWNITNNSSYDIVHAQYWSPAFLPVLIAILRKLKNKPIKVVLTWHNPSPHEKYPFLKHAEKILLSLCDKIICHTADGATILDSITQKKEISIIHHGCHTNEILLPSSVDYERCNASPKFQYILYFGNIRPYKGVSMLLDAWGEISDHHKNVKLIIAGRLWDNSGSSLSKIMHKISGTSSYASIVNKKLHDQSKNVIADIQFIPQEKLLSYLRISNYAVFPYLAFESQSGAASLAVSNGLPILTTNVGGLSELAIDQNFISKDLSAKAFSVLLDNRINNYKESFRNDQSHKSENHSWTSSANKHINTYEEFFI